MHIYSTEISITQAGLPTSSVHAAADDVTADLFPDAQDVYSRLDITKVPTQTAHYVPPSCGSFQSSLAGALGGPHVYAYPSTTPSARSPPHQSLLTGTSTAHYPFPTVNPRDTLLQPNTAGQLDSSHRRTETHPQRRNAIVPPDEFAAAAKAAAALSSRAARDKYKCPHCPFVQKARRKADLDRHVATHTGKNEFVCRGVRAEKAGVYEVPVELLDGSEWVGGCGKTFSRRDALARHIKNSAGRCYGDASSQ